MHAGEFENGKFNEHGLIIFHNLILNKGPAVRKWERFNRELGETLN